MKEFGKELGDIVKIVLIDNEELEAVDPQKLIRKVAEGIRGLIDVAFNNRLPNLVACVDDVEEVVVDLDAVIDDFKIADISHMIDGISKIGDMI